MKDNSQWLCFQAGSREKYKIAEIFSINNKLDKLITDIYLPKDTLLSKVLRLFNNNAATRFNSYIPENQVKNFNWYFLRNIIFKGNVSDLQYQSKFSEYLRTKKNLNPETIVFSYNYIANKIFREAKKKGLKTVLGQIDAGPFAGKLAKELANNEFGNRFMPHDLYNEYEESWREECEMADLIIVNSEWSGECLIKENIKKDKIRIIPLVYVPPKESFLFNRTFKKEFNKKKPLKILFLGSLQIQKGIMPLIRAARELENAPIEITMVGALKMPEWTLSNLPQNVKWHRRVSAEKTREFYQEADVFILPTYSDGFAVTQLEAQAWKLPVITTPFCGKVVDHEKNGLILTSVHEDTIAGAIKYLLENPEKLRYYSSNSENRLMKYTTDQVALQYMELERQL